jgi:hypothetical protein
MKELAQLAERYDAFEQVDHSDFQRRARILQSMWREEKGYPVGKHDDRVYGARLEMPWAEDTLANFMSETAKEAVRNEVLDPDKSKGKLYGKPRIFNNLLSSQPLCFNLFAELQQDTGLATEILRSLDLQEISQVTSVQFEHSPGRRDPEYTGDRSAFDVFIEYRTKDGRSGFLGVEVKYHENLKGAPANLRDRYEEVAQEMGCFRDERLPDLRSQPLQQIWRDHLLACSVILHRDYDEGSFVFLYPEQNPHCHEAIREYRNCLVNDDCFRAWTLESMLGAIRTHTRDPWARRVYERYLDFAKLDSAME